MAEQTSPLVDLNGLQHFFSVLNGIYNSKFSTLTIDDINAAIAQYTGNPERIFSTNALLLHNVNSGNKNGHILIERLVDANGSCINFTDIPDDDVNYSDVTLRLPLSNGYIFTSANFNPATKADSILIPGTRISILQTPTANAFKTSEDENLVEGDVVFFQENGGSNPKFGFYYKTSGSYVKICTPVKFSLYFNKTDNKFCVWNGYSFSNITIEGSNGNTPVEIDGEEYQVATNTAIDNMIDAIINGNVDPSDSEPKENNED